MSRNSGTHQRTASFLALGCVGFIASAAAPAPALAQDQTEPTRLEGVTVTDSGIDEGYRAEAVSSPKATAALVDTPRTVTVVTEEVLRDTASYSLEEALRTVPGITLGAGEGGVASADIPLIRGVDATGDVFVDGARDVGSQTRETFALESLEVSKGPDSTFGGRGTAAGAINLVSKVARQGNFATAQITGGTSDLLRITGDINAEIADKLAVRLVALYHDSNVPGRDAVYDDRWGFQPSISWGVGTDVTASLTYYHFETDAMPDYGLPLTSRDQLPGGVRVAADVDPDNFYGLLSRDFRDTRVDSATFQFSGYLGSGLTLSNTTRYSDSANSYIVTNPDDSAGNVQNGFVWRNIKSRGSTSQGITSNTNLSAVFDTGGLKHSLALGYEMNVTDGYNLGYTVDTGNYRFTDPGTGCTTAALPTYNCTTLDNPDPNDPWNGSVARSTGTPSTASAEEHSLYLFDTVTVTPRLLLNGGLRWTRFSAEGAGSGRGGAYDARNSGSFWTWQGGVIFKPTEATSVYFSYANSKTPPGATVGDGSSNIGSGDDILKPQSFENWEVGAKAQLFDGGLLLSGALFRVNRDNIIAFDGDEVVDTFEAARLQGLELSATGVVGPVSLVVGYTYVDSELREDAAAQDDDPSNDASSNVGNRLPQTPVHNFAATLKWDVTPRFSVGAGAYGASRRYADAQNLISADGYVRFDANASYQFTDHIGLRVNVQNIGDERYIVKLRNPHFAVPANGRQAIATLTVSY